MTKEDQRMIKLDVSYRDYPSKARLAKRKLKNNEPHIQISAKAILNAT